jgi:hypothetical protein
MVRGGDCLRRGGGDAAVGRARDGLICTVGSRGLQRGWFYPHRLGVGAAASESAVASCSSPEVDGLIGIWGGGSRDPTPISGGEDLVVVELGVMW